MRLAVRRIFFIYAFVFAHLAGAVVTTTGSDSAAPGSSATTATTFSTTHSSSKSRTARTASSSLKAPHLTDACLQAHPKEWAERLTELRTVWAVVAVQCQGFGISNQQYKQFTETNNTAILESQAILSNAFGSSKPITNNKDYFKNYDQFYNGDKGVSQPSHSVSERSRSFDGYHAGLTNEEYDGYVSRLTSQEYDGSVYHPGVNVVGAAGYCPSHIADYNTGTAYTSEQLLARLSQEVCGTNGTATLAAKGTDTVRSTPSAQDLQNSASAVGTASTSETANDGEGASTRTSGRRYGSGWRPGVGSTATSGRGSSFGASSTTSSYPAAALPYRARDGAPPAVTYRAGGDDPLASPVTAVPLAAPARLPPTQQGSSATGETAVPVVGSGDAAGATAPDTDLNGISIPGFARPAFKAPTQRGVPGATGAASASSFGTASVLGGASGAGGIAGQTGAFTQPPFISTANCDSTPNFATRIHEVDMFVNTYSLKCGSSSFQTVPLAVKFNNRVKDYLTESRPSSEAWSQGNYNGNARTLSQSPDYCTKYQSYFKQVTSLPKKEDVKSFVCH